MTNEEKEEKEKWEAHAKKYSDWKIVICEYCPCREYNDYCNLPKGLSLLEYEPFSDGNWHTFVEEKACPVLLVHAEVPVVGAQLDVVDVVQLAHPGSGRWRFAFHAHVHVKVPV